MGASYSEDRDVGENANDAAVAAQQQRAQLMFLQQLQEARAMQQVNGGNGDPLPSPPASLGGPQQLLPVGQPGLRMSKVYRNPVHLQGKTLAIHGREVDGPTEPVLRFNFDCLTPCVVVVHRHATLTLGRGGWAVESSEWSSSPAHFDAGLGQTHEVGWGQLRQVNGAGSGVCQLLVEVRSDVLGAEGSVVTTEWTFGCAMASDRVEVVRQQVVCGQNQVLDVLEVFGSEASVDGSSRRDTCVVCQTEPCDTAALPCRHMCLCGGCSEYIRTRVQHRSYKCPICRERISRMMRIEASEAELDVADASECDRLEASEPS